MSESQKPNSAEDSLGPAVRRNRSAAARRAARLRKVTREARIIGLLNRGVSVVEIAAREGLSLKRMRNLVREILAKPMPQPPAEFLSLQISRSTRRWLLQLSYWHH
jgi:DNA-binding NarL/FixJ family response regulator